MEYRRMEALRRYDILDTPPDQALDDITSLAAHICATPIALISLIDSDRLWFKSKIGLTESETARESALCSHAMRHPNQIMVVPDARADIRFAHTPLVTHAPHIRFYAGLPLVTSDGHVLGTLCVIDRVVRELTVEQLAALRALRRSVMAEFELRRHVAEMERTTATLTALRAQLEQEVREREAGLDRLEQRYRTLFDAHPHPIWVYDIETLRFLEVNAACVRNYGYTRTEFRAMTIEQIRPPEEIPVLRKVLREVGGQLRKTGVSHHRTKGGQDIHAEIVSFPVEFDGRPARVVVATDITERLQAEAVRKYAQEMLAGQKQLLETTASDASLTDSLHVINHIVEAQFPGMLCSVLLLDETGTRIMRGAAASLPEDYNAAIDGVAIGPSVGSCGTAMYSKQTVIVKDIATDPKWVGYAEYALRHGLRACWSTPIISSTGRVLGAFAMYFREPREPGQRELDAMSTNAALAAVAIERKRVEEHLRLLARARKVTADCNRVLVYASDEQRLLQDMCRIVVDSGGYRMAWIGLVRHDAEHTIEPVASAGDDGGYLASVQIS